ncbi:hypothetical protein LSH36_164g02020 [Paralvinella palmiformis]|uniref:Uncharacterized protein n=1 Tax=Paralvinella palmiformis TaxID=53620 RepID=A0AAD9N8B9_9ANNE|nr:hypothetical protein LSH36_164g02020 [Paralvinella palmiformis]
MAGYRTVRYYRNLNIMVLDNKHIMDNPLSGKDVLTLVHAIEDGEQEELKTMLSNLPDKNISDVLVTTTLPKRWHRVAKTVKSTPLRTAISWRNTSALDAILDSDCIVTNMDLSIGLQKILRHIESETEIYIISRLVKSGAEVDNPAGFNLTFEKMILLGELDRCKQVVRVICQSCPYQCITGNATVVCL